MINIRKNLFETNSSSVHSITMCDEADYAAWVAGTKFFCDSTNKFYDEVELLIYVKSKKLLNDVFNYDWKAYTFEYDGKTYNINERYDIANLFVNTISDEDAKEYYEQMKLDDPNEVPIDFERWTEYKEQDFETYSDTFTTKDGSTVTAFGYYGHD